jgi:hypothetical protein
LKNVIVVLVVLGFLAGAGHTLYTYRETENKNTQLKTAIAHMEEETKAPPPPPKIKEQIIVRKDGSPPRKIVQVDNSEAEAYQKDQQIKIELIGVLKLQINENNSWETVAKLLVLILVSYGGIKIINRVFKDTK